jgi:hypothetical protein
MSELQILFVVLVVLYLIQCVAWVPQDSTAFRATLFSGWKLEPEGFRLAARLRAVPGNPLPPFHGVAVCPPQLVSVSPLGMLTGGTGAQAFQPFDGMREIRAAGKHLRIAGAPLLTAGSPGEAARLAAWLEKIHALAEKKRAAAIEKHLAAEFDFERASQRFAEFRARTRLLQWTSTALFSFLFLFVPLIVDAVGLARVWPELAAALVVLVAAIAWDFRRAHRKLHPQEGEARWTAMLTIILSPVAAIRPKDVLFRDLFAGFHPLAVARVLCAPEEFRRVAARMLREFTFPIPGSQLAGDEPAARCDAWFRERQTAALRRFLAESGAKPEELLAPPARSGPQSASYCPRCCQQYAVLLGACPDCGGIALEPLPENEATTGGNA